MVTPSALPTHFLTHAHSNLTQESLAAQERLASSHRTKAIAIPTGFAVGVLGAIFLAPGWINAIGIVATVCLSKATSYYKNQTLLSKQAKEQAETIKKIQHNYETLNQLSTEDYRARLIFFGIFTAQEADLIVIDKEKDTKDLCVLVAHYQYHLELSQNLEIENCKHLAEARESQGTPEEQRKSLFDAHCKVLKKEQKAFTAKAEAAFIRAAIHYPSFTGMPSDLYTINPSPLEERLVSLGTGNVDEWIFFKERAIEPVTVGQMRNLEIETLSALFLVAMQARTSTAAA